MSQRMHPLRGHLLTHVISFLHFYNFSMWKPNHSGSSNYTNESFPRCEFLTVNPVISIEWFLLSDLQQSWEEGSICQNHLVLLNHVKSFFWNCLQLLQDFPFVVFNNIGRVIISITGKVDCVDYEEKIAKKYIKE